MASELNRRVKRWPGWVALIFVVAGFLAVGATRDTGPESQGDRIDELSKRVACPICDGESVFESQNNASIALRNQIADLVADNDLNDSEIIAFIETRYGADGAVGAQVERVRCAGVGAAGGGVRLRSGRVDRRVPPMETRGGRGRRSDRRGPSAR